MGDALLVAGAIGAALAACGALVLREGRWRWAAAAVALALAATVIAADSWDDARVADLRESPAALALALATGGVAVALLAAALRNWPAAFPVLAVAALPFRVPIDLGADDANLLLPLYVVLAAATAAAAWDAARGRRPAVAAGGEGGEPPAGLPGLAARRLPWLLGAVLVLYAAQSAYSDDLSAALRNLCFFYVPFAVLLALLMRVRWSTGLLVALGGVLVAEGIAFALVGLVEYAVRDLLWNPEVIAANRFHPYFRVNSLFWDPNILSRYLAVTVAFVAALMLWTRSRRVAAGSLAVALLLLATMTITFSQSGLVALLAGLAALAALRWSARWSLAAGAAGGALALVFLLATGSSFNLDLKTRALNKQTSGRVELIEGGVKLAERRPLAGWGSGSFSKRFGRRFGGRDGATASHTEPVTVAAEQGAIGLAAYLALLAGALTALLAGMGPLAPGLRGFRAAREPPDPGRERTVLSAARAGVLAGFVVMVVHSLSYAAFLTDPIVWVLLAVGLTLVRSPLAARRSEQFPAGTGAEAPPPAVAAAG